MIDPRTKMPVTPEIRYQFQCIADLLTEGGLRVKYLEGPFLPYIMVGSPLRKVTTQKVRDRLADP